MWQAMFGMDVSVWEKLLRTLVLYAFLVIALRLSGKRMMAQLTTFDFVVLLLVSNAVQNGLIGNDTSVTGAAIGAGALFLLNGMLAYLFFRSRKAQRLVEGKAVILVRDGRVDDKALRAQRFTMTDLMIELQDAGVTELDQVKTARLEANGQLLVTQVPAKDQSAQRLHALQAHNLQLEQSIHQLHLKIDRLLAAQRGTGPLPAPGAAPAEPAPAPPVPAEPVTAAGTAVDDAPPTKAEG